MTTYKTTYSGGFRVENGEARPLTEKEQKYEDSYLQSILQSFLPITMPLRGPEKPADAFK